MLDFTVDRLKRQRAELHAVPAPGTTPRAPADRRAAATSPAAPTRRRRRHDGMYAGQPAPLAW